MGCTNSLICYASLLIGEGVNDDLIILNAEIQRLPLHYHT